jgi:hypothetical protein
MASYEKKIILQNIKFDKRVSSQAQNGQSNGKNGQNGRRSSINARCYSLFLFIEGVVDGSKQWIRLFCRILYFAK